MTIRTIYHLLDQISPFEMQEKWDNSGLLVGDFDTKIEHIVLSLEIDKDILKKVKQNTLIITHHPLIFSPLNKIIDELWCIIKKDRNALYTIDVETKYFVIIRGVDIRTMRFQEAVTQKEIEMLIEKEKE